MERRRSSKPSGDGGVIPEPEPAHLASDHGSDDEREATEMREGARASSVRRVNPGEDMWYPVRKWWRENIRLSVPSVDCRDHYGQSFTASLTKKLMERGTCSRFPALHRYSTLLANHAPFYVDIRSISQMQLSQMQPRVEVRLETPTNANLIQQTSVHF
jgi:hypothetical protein